MKTKTTVLPFLKLLVLGFLPLCPTPKAFGVSPPPDGGYPNGNTAEGQDALLSLTTGIYNTAAGFFSLRSDTTGSFNTATGTGALLDNTFGANNTANGAFALFSNTTGTQNTATGYLALLSNTDGNFNVAIGAGALVDGPSGNDNTAVGFNALHNGGDTNTAVGSRALQANRTGPNTAVGFMALATNNTGMFNTAIGTLALSASTTDDANTAVGHAALLNFSNITIPFSGGNTAVGQGALSNDTTGAGNTALGADAGSNVTTANNVICIGANVAGNNVDNSCYIGNIFNATSSGGIGVFVNSNGRLGTVTSSRRFKEDIKPIDQGSEGLYALEPVTFRYKKDIDPERTGAPQFGLVAEDVEKMNPGLVVYDKEGKPYSVRYDQVNAMLLNEFLKEHRKVQQMEANAVQQEKEINLLRSELNEQMALIQRLNDKIELNKTPRQTVTNDR
jgi:hypothetical protein